MHNDPLPCIECGLLPDQCRCPPLGYAAPLDLKCHTGAVKLSTKAKIAIGKKRGSQRANRITREFYKQ